VGQAAGSFTSFGLFTIRDICLNGVHEGFAVGSIVQVVNVPDCEGWKVLAGDYVPIKYRAKVFDEWGHRFLCRGCDL